VRAISHFFVMSISLADVHNIVYILSTVNSIYTKKEPWDEKKFGTNGFCYR
jgi:hypothetical protein